MISKLPNECLQQIFRYIKDINSLYSIIQVDHTWCEIGQIWVINLLILLYMAKRKASIRWFKIDNKYAYFESLIIDRMENENGYHNLDNGLIVDQYYNITNKIEDIFTVFLRFDESKI